MVLYKVCYSDHIKRGALLKTFIRSLLDSSGLSGFAGLLKILLALPLCLVHRYKLSLESFLQHFCGEETLLFAVCCVYGHSCRSVRQPLHAHALLMINDHNENVHTSPISLAGAAQR